jgi:hypothetical protein
VGGGGGGGVRRARRRVLVIAYCEPEAQRASGALIGQLYYPSSSNS